MSAEVYQLSVEVYLEWLEVHQISLDALLHLWLAGTTRSWDHPLPADDSEASHPAAVGTTCQNPGLNYQSPKKTKATI